MRTIATNIFGFMLILFAAYDLTTKTSHASDQYHDKIIPFHSVNGIIPSFSKYSNWTTPHLVDVLQGL